ncbi:MAG TPA: hypothetical protein VJ714_12335, partial [Anaerolineae bacterium]|nr:hypothetical protein [Anaerolineae bacterium]
MKRSRAVLLSLVSLIVLLAASTALARGAVAQGPYKVGLVVRFGDGSVFTDCVEFTSPEITGEDVLDRSGLSVIKDPSYGLGAAVCKIGNNGCNYPTQHCFCKCTGEPPCLYWAYYYLDRQESAWIYSGMGASWHTVQAGDVEGWAWGDGEYGGSAVEPPLMTFEELCAPPSPPMVDLSADPENIIAGQCSTVRWTVENAVA